MTLASGGSHGATASSKGLLDSKANGPLGFLDPPRHRQSALAPSDAQHQDLVTV